MRDADLFVPLFSILFMNFLRVQVPERSGVRYVVEATSRRYAANCVWKNFCAQVELSLCLSITSMRIGLSFLLAARADEQTYSM